MPMATYVEGEMVTTRNSNKATMNQTQARRRGTSNVGQTNEAQQRKDPERNRVPPETPARKDAIESCKQQREEPRTPL